MAPYYLDVALLGLGMTIGSLVQAAERAWTRRRVVPVLLLGFLVLSNISVRVEAGRSPLVRKAAFAERMVADVASSVSP
jgi:hypothetical protein